MRSSFAWQATHVVTSGRARSRLNEIDVMAPAALSFADATLGGERAAPNPRSPLRRLNSARDIRSGDSRGMEGNLSRTGHGVIRAVVVVIIAAACTATLLVGVGAAQDDLVQIDGRVLWIAGQTMGVA